MSAEARLDGKPPVRREPATAVAFIAICLSVWIGDRLLWDHFPGVSLPLFLISLAIIHLALNRGKAAPQNILAGFLALCIGLLPTIETINILTTLSGIGGTFAACMIFRGDIPAMWPERLNAFFASLRLAGHRFPHFALSTARTMIPIIASGKLRGWLVPILMAAVFVTLFVGANPIWQQWLEQIDIAAASLIVVSDRFAFWVALSWLAYPLIEQTARVHRRMKIPRRWVSRVFPARNNFEENYKSAAFFERCLILFNLVFAVQTVLDLTYLWAGAVLPEGMTYASYAHRGAYPLVVAALLAGAFVITAMRPGGPGEQSTRVKWLVLFWVAQNLMLLVSSVLRLELYVEAYGLTYWRLASFIWMALVATGLILIVTRFVLGKSSAWLMTTNFLVLLATLYGTSLMNFPYVISMWNVTHSSYLIAGGAPLDLRYLGRLGPNALPAVRLLQSTSGDIPDSGRHNLDRVANKMLRDARHENGKDWRSWTFRKERLDWFFDGTRIASNPVFSEVSEVPDPR